MASPVGGPRTVEQLLREARARLKRLSPEAAASAAGAGGLIVDIRSEGQREHQGIVPGAHFVPRNVLEWRADPTSGHLDPVLARVRGPLILMCAQGYQSSLAAATLQDLGVTRATDMIGGFEAWRDGGLPVLRPGEPPESPDRHWDGIYGRLEPEALSWYAPSPAVSLELIDAAGPAPARSVIDIGGGTSGLVDELVARGFADLTVLDVSAVALERSRERLGPAGRRVRWIRADVCAWAPERTYDLWHDRAVFHFLVNPSDRERYRRAATASLERGAHLVIGTFSPAGPPTCSGLTVLRYDAGGLVRALGPGFTLIEARAEEHVTPRGARQPFTWALLRRE